VILRILTESYHSLGAASVARAWSGYVDSLVGGVISNYTRDVVMDGYSMGEPLGAVPDFLASGLCLAYATLLGLGVKASTTVNSLLTIVNLAVMGLVIVLGIYYADITNWSSENGGFLPYGFGGVITGKSSFTRLIRIPFYYTGCFLISAKNFRR